MQVWSAHVLPGIYRIVLGVQLTSDRLPLYSPIALEQIRDCEIGGVQVSELWVKLRDQADLVEFLSELHEVCIPIYSVTVTELLQES